MRSTHTRRQGGFTLIEMLVVVVVIGILIAVFTITIKGAIDKTKALALEKQATTLGSHINALADACGVSTLVSGNPIPTSGKTLLDVLMDGQADAVSTYQGCLQSSSLKPLSNTFSQTASGWALEGFPVTLAGGGTSPVQVIYANVPDTVTLKLLQARDKSITELAGSDTTSTYMQYGTADSDGTRTVTFFEQ